MRLFLLCSLAAAGLWSSPSALAQQSASSHAITISLGLSGGTGIPFTPMHPTQLELSGVSRIRTDAETGWFAGSPEEAYSVNLFLRLARSKWFLQPEIGYQSLLSSPVAFEDDYSTGFGGIITAGREDFHNFRSDQLSLSTLAGCYVGSGRHFYILTGPAVGFRVGSDGYSSPRTELGKEIIASLNRAPETTRFSFQGGLGYWGLARHLNFEFRYTRGLTPLVQEFTFRDEKYALKAQAHVLTLTIGLTLDFKGNASTAR